MPASIGRAIVCALFALTTAVLATPFHTAIARMPLTLLVVVWMVLAIREMRQGEK